ncbi:MAG: nuclear transport factor 2 family protein [Actinobacteria bacterium]|nr:nuclear transport factor 2 family protein [Actinomycetota bacterium]
MSVAVRLRDAMNAHDLEAFLACFHQDYQSEQPVQVSVVVSRSG